MSRKLELYRKAGVREYWIVDPESNVLTVHHFGGDAPAMNIYGASGTVEAAIFPGLVISLEEVFAS